MKLKENLTFWLSLSLLLLAIMTSLLNPGRRLVNKSRLKTFNTIIKAYSIFKCRLLSLSYCLNYNVYRHCNALIKCICYTNNSGRTHMYVCSFCNPAYYLLCWESHPNWNEIITNPLLWVWIYKTISYTS